MNKLGWFIEGIYFGLVIIVVELLISEVLVWDNGMIIFCITWVILGSALNFWAFEDRRVK